MKNHSIYSILENFTKTYANIDVKKYKGQNLIKEFEELQAIRNNALHKGKVVNKLNSEHAIKISKMYYLLIEEFMGNIGLQIDRRDWNIKQK
jgi:hypothetical protein